MAESAFFGINVATRGLYTARTALDIVNHNISNMETDGYSRQYADIQATRPMPAHERGMIGTGAEITEVKRYRNEYLDEKYWALTTTQGEYEVKDELMTQIETLFNEPSDTGMTSQFSKMFDTIQDLSTNTSEVAAKNNLVDSMKGFASYYNDLHDRLVEFQRDANYGVKTTVESINFIASELAAVNDQIANLELYGGPANDLRDERVRLIDDLSELINVETQELTDANGKESFRVTINGQLLVDDNSANQLELVPRERENNPEDQPDMYDVYFKTGNALYLSGDKVSGKLKGYMEIRDGNNQENFQGDIVSGAGTTTLTLENFNRSDLADMGELRFGNEKIEYTSYTYIPASAGPPATKEQIQFTLASAAPAGATTTQIGDSVDYKGVPHYIQQLNEYVRTIAMEFNKIHKKGDGGKGEELFSFEGYNDITNPLDEDNLHTYNQITIENFKLDQRIQDDIENLHTGAADNAGDSANDLILEMANLRHDTEVFDKGTPENYMQAMIGTIGIDTKQAQVLKTSQENLQRLIDNQRESVSGVDLNEETTDIIRFQQAFNLSAKMISVMDEIFEVTINQLKR